MNSLKLVKLDRRHAGYGVWGYYVERPRYLALRESKQIFYSWREWCWSTWGASKEMENFDHYDMFDGLHCSNSRWSWISDVRNRIFLRSDQEASVFVLRWS